VPLAAFAPLELDGDGGQEGLAALRRRAFLAGPVDDPVTGDAYAYRHALLRDAGYASLARAERARLHAAMARWLESIAGERADVVAEAIAEHLGSALDSLPALATSDLPDRTTLAADAAAWYERAAEAGLRLAAIEAAQRLFTRSIELTAEEARIDAARRHLRLGEILAASADLDAGIGEMQAALDGFGDHPDGVADAAYALARAYMQQIRFTEAEELTAATLQRLPERPPERRARLQALHAWSIGAQGRSDGVRAETDLAWATAEAAGDPALEVDVLQYVNAARDEIEEATESDWALLEEKAVAAGRWSQVVVAGRIRGELLANADPRAGLVRIDAAGRLAAAQGLTEQGGWTMYSRVEGLWVLGDWSDAIDLGRRAIELGERYAYQRLAFRTWAILLQMAGPRHDESLAEHWERWWAGAADHFGSLPSAYARVLHGAIAIWIAQATGQPVLVPQEDLTHALIAFSNPHYLGAAETVVRAWLDAERVDLVAAAAERSAAFAAAPDATRLMHISAALLDAWATGSAKSARTVLDLARSHPAPWWELRALEALGDEAAASKVRHALGIPATAG
jgi:hypothetical protein